MRKTGSCEAEPRGQRLRHLEVGARLPERRHGPVAVLHVVGAVGTVEVLGLQIGRRRQHDVGVARGHGQEGVVHHREQVLAGEPAAGLARVRVGDGGIVAGDEEAADRRVRHLQQRLAEAQVVDEPRGGGPRRLADGVVVEVARGRSQQQRAAAGAAVGARDARQQRHRAQRLSAVGEPRHALAEADEGGLGAPVHGGEALDVGHAEPGDLGHACRREARQHLGLHPIEADRVGRQIALVAQASRAPGCA